MLKGLCQPGRPVFSSRGLAWHRGAAAGVPRPHSRRRRRGDIITSRLTSPLVARRVCLLLARIGVDVLRLHRENRKTPEVRPRNCRRWLRRAPLQSRRPNRLQRACACARCAVRVHTQCSDTVCWRARSTRKSNTVRAGELAPQPIPGSRDHRCRELHAHLLPGMACPRAAQDAAHASLGPPAPCRGWSCCQTAPVGGGPSHLNKKCFSELPSKALPRRAGAARGFCTRRSLDR